MRALLIACTVGLTVAVAAGPPAAPSLRITAPSLTVVPPGPVHERVAVEVRVAVPNVSAAPRPAEVRFFWDAPDAAHQFAAEAVMLAPGERALVRAWAPCRGKAGRHTLIAQIRQAGRIVQRGWPLSVLTDEAPPSFGAVWFDPGGLTAYAHDGPVTAADVTMMVASLHRLGVSTVIVTYVEYFGRFYYPSDLRFYDRDTKSEAQGLMYDFDVVGAVLEEADRLGMHVFLGLGRGGDTPLLWEFDAPDWQARNATAIRTSQRVAADLWRRYREHTSLYGWYLTHEMADLARASAYYDPVADYCHGLSPDKPVLVAPAGTPTITPDLLRASHVDIFAYGDAVGAGYVPEQYTYQPENRLRMLEGCYDRYRQWHQGTDKHLWTDLELWEMDGSQGYSGAYAAPWARVRRQLAVEAPRVEFVTAYECSGFLQDPAARRKLKDPRASELYRAYQGYLSGVARSGGGNGEE